MSRSALRAVLCAGLLGATGCAVSSQVGTSSCRSELKQDGRPLEGAVDSVGLAHDVRAAWAEGTGLTLAIVAYDSVGALDTVEVVSAAADLRERRRIQGAVRHHASPRGEPAGRLHIVVGDASGPGPRRVGGFKSCAPTLLHRDWLAAQLRTEGELLRPVRRLTVRVMARVQTDGLVSEVRIRESSGDRGADEAAVRILNRATFQPGAVEGIPVEVWASLPITFSPSRGTGRGAGGDNQPSNKNLLLAG